jgi:hypothetical protein
MVQNERSNLASDECLDLSVQLKMLDETLYSSLISDSTSNNRNNCGNKINIDSDDNNDNENKNKYNNNDKSNNNNNDNNINKMILEQIKIFNHITATIKSMNVNLSKIDSDDLKILGNSCLLNLSLKDFISPIIKISKLFMDDKTKISQRWVSPLLLMYT